jgi:ligand-binding sensor domain-containing protein/DNA-binding CsgD family transcriptional regulator
MKKLYLIFSLLLLPGLSFAEWTNLIYNYSRNDYKAGSQNWQIIQMDNHWMCFANKMGVLEYNGKDWNLYPLNNNTDARCVFYSRKDNRIYVGGINELGYLESVPGGKRRYHSIWDHHSQQSLELGNIWKIYEIDDAIYFCGDQTVVKWVNDSFTPIKAPDKIDCSNMINNTLHIGTASGVFVLAGGAFYRLQHAEHLIQKQLRAILPFGKQVMIATTQEGLFLWDEETGLQPFHTDVDNFLKDNFLFSIASQNGQIAIGTVLKGLVLITPEGKLIKYINESHGLQNNTILSVFFDINDNLWLGLDNGIDYIALNYPVTTLYSTAKFYGAGYVAKLYKDKLYLGTNRGLYVTDWPVPNTESPPELKFVEGTQGQVWNLQVIDEQLFLCHDRGLFIVESKGLRDLNLRVGVWDLRPKVQTINKFWISTYNGFYILDKKSHNEFDIQTIPSISNSIINFEEDNADHLFLRYNWNELIRLTMDSVRDQIENEKHFGPDNFLENYFIHKFNDQIVLSSPSGFYTCSNDHFVPDTHLNRIFETNEKSGAFRNILQENNTTWALGENVLAVQYNNSELPVICYHTIPLISNFEYIYPVSDSSVIIPNENGFALWNTTALIKKPNYPLQIRSVSIVKGAESQDDNLFASDSSEIPQIQYKNNSLFIRYNLINYSNQSKTRFRTQLDNEVWSDYSTSDSKTISDIPIGAHTFRVATQLDDGSWVEDSFSFVILPPWYLTIWAYGGYLILLFSFAFGLWTIDNQRIKRKERQMKLAQNKVIELKEEAFKAENEKKEQEIIRLKNEQLEMNIQHKSQELANSAMSLGRKNEVLIEIKENLSKIFNKTNQTNDLSIFKRIILQVNNKIDENIREDDSLHQFEENFDLVHNNFIRRLSTEYPSLTMAERKMCAYIKMQLSSKEIAPLLNISIRGTETLRYRLRKKLGLHRDESLTQFLMNY